MAKLTNLAFVALATFSACTDDGLDTATTPLISQNCTLTQGYWKNHPAAWPVSSVTLGSVSYTEKEALAILQQPVKGNGLISLAHQLIAAKLNVAAGASNTVAGAIAQADAQIGGLIVPPIGSGKLPTSATASLVATLDDYNNGVTGPGHCGDTPPPPVCGDGAINQAGEQCDDGNTTDGDGCSSTCQIEPPPCVCGDGVIHDGEECDDGNTIDGDGCSSTCQVEPSCGDGSVNQETEQCDDGNTTAGDGCSSTCQIEPPPPTCGDGSVNQQSEQCDDGNTIDGDGCSSTCQRECTCH